jgi:hypothetical protein
MLSGILWLAALIRSNACVFNTDSLSAVNHRYQFVIWLAAQLARRNQGTELWRLAGKRMKNQRNNSKSVSSQSELFKPVYH